MLYRSNIWMILIALVKLWTEAQWPMLSFYARTYLEELKKTAKTSVMITCTWGINRTWNFEKDAVISQPRNSICTQLTAQQYCSVRFSVLDIVTTVMNSRIN